MSTRFGRVELFEREAGVSKTSWSYGDENRVICKEKFARIVRDVVLSWRKVEENLRERKMKESEKAILSEISYLYTRQMHKLVVAHCEGRNALAVNGNGSATLEVHSVLCDMNCG
jgi:hypothetical protein